MHLYKTDDFRTVVRTLADEKGFTFREIAERSNIHASYFSRVMKERASFSQEQLFLVGKALGLSGDDLDYLLLLGELAASGNNHHRSHIQDKIRGIREQKNKVINRLERTQRLDEQDMSVYYAEAITARIHMYLTIERFRRQPLLIARQLHVTEVKLNLELQKLQTLGLLRFEEGQWHLQAKRVHLEAESPLSPQNHVNWRLEAISHITRRGSKASDYHMSAVFSSDEDAKVRIRDLFKEFVVSAQKESGRAATATDVFVIAFDLFGS